MILICCEFGALFCKFELPGWVRWKKVQLKWLLVWISKVGTIKIMFKVTCQFYIKIFLNTKEWIWFFNLDWLKSYSCHLNTRLPILFMLTVKNLLDSDCSLPMEKIEVKLGSINMNYSEGHDSNVTADEQIKLASNRRHWKVIIFIPQKRESLRAGRSHDCGDLINFKEK